MSLENFKFLNKRGITNLPKMAGVYCFRDNKNIILSREAGQGSAEGRFLYIGKGANIRIRVKNHFQQPSYRDNLFMNQVAKIGYIETGSEIEALLLEAKLIKKYQPKYNIIWRDDKNYFYVGVTKPASPQGEEELPRIFITHQIQNSKVKTIHIGPFVEGKSLKRTLDFLRKVFPYYTRAKHPKGYCLWCSLKLCPGPNPDKKQYKKNIRNLIAVLEGKRLSVLKSLKQEMKQLSKAHEFEKAGKKRDQIIMLEKIIAHSKVLEPQIIKEDYLKKEKDILMGRIESYDISNTQGQEATGSMAVFKNGLPDKSQYRKFKIKITGKPNDTAMIKEMLSRRLNHPEWPYPDLMIIDGGKAQLNAAITAKNKMQRTKNIKIAALAKKNNEFFQEGEKKPVLLKDMNAEFANLILRSRDEAHRFALSYHKKLRQKGLIKG